MENSKVNNFAQSIQNSQLTKSSAVGVDGLSKANSNAGQALKDLPKQQIKSFEEAFAKIMSATGINDIDQLVKTFI